MKCTISWTHCVTLEQAMLFPQQGWGIWGPVASGFSLHPLQPGSTHTHTPSLPATQCFCVAGIYSSTVVVPLACLKDAEVFILEETKLKTNDSLPGEIGRPEISAPICTLLHRSGSHVIVLLRVGADHSQAEAESECYKLSHLLASCRLLRFGQLYTARFPATA